MKIYSYVLYSIQYHALYIECGGLAYWVLASSVFAKTILVCNALIPYWLELTSYFCSPPNRPFSSFINKISKGKHPILEI